MHIAHPNLQNRLFFNWPLICHLFLGGHRVSYFSYSLRIRSTLCTLSCWFSPHYWRIYCMSVYNIYFSKCHTFACLFGSQNAFWFPFKPICLIRNYCGISVIRTAPRTVNSTSFRFLHFIFSHLRQYHKMSASQVNTDFLTFEFSRTHFRWYSITEMA